MQISGKTEVKKILLEIELGRPIEPTEVRSILEIVKKAVSYGPYIVILSGRLPTWLFAALTHHFHPSYGVAVFDPRYQAGIVVATHHLGLSIGDLVTIEGAEKVVIKYP